MSVVLFISTLVGPFYTSIHILVHFIHKTLKLLWYYNIWKHMHPPSFGRKFILSEIALKMRFLWFYGNTIKLTNYLNLHKGKIITYKILLLLFLEILMLNGSCITSTLYSGSEAAVPLNSFTNWWGTSYLLLLGSVICKDILNYHYLIQNCYWIFQFWIKY